MKNVRTLVGKPISLPHLGPVWVAKAALSPGGQWQWQRLTLKFATLVCHQWSYRGTAWKNLACNQAVCRQVASALQVPLDSVQVDPESPEHSDRWTSCPDVVKLLVKPEASLGGLAPDDGAPVQCGLREAKSALEQAVEDYRKTPALAAPVLRGNKVAIFAPSPTRDLVDTMLMCLRKNGLSYMALGGWRPATSADLHKARFRSTQVVHMCEFVPIATLGGLTEAAEAVQALVME
jgi:hypothetical protein